MKKAILATKVGMTQIFNEDGMLIPVTVLQAGPCVVTQVKTDENDGYTAVQVGFGEIREKLVNKPEKGHFAKAGVDVKRFLKEFRFDNAAEYEVGQEIKADILQLAITSMQQQFQKVKASGRNQETWTVQRTYGSRLQISSSCRFQWCLF